jgi:SsrA-binding protein
MQKGGAKLINNNRKAYRDYFILETFEAGIILQGTEIKSLRKNGCTLKDAYVQVKDNKVIVFNFLIPKYDHGNIFNHEPERLKTLLLHQKEIKKLIKETKIQGLTIIPTKCYLIKGMAKLEIGLAKGKKLYDKRESKKLKEIDKGLRSI